VEHITKTHKDHITVCLDLELTRIGRSGLYGSEASRVPAWNATPIQKRYKMFTPNYDKTTRKAKTLAKHMCTETLNTKSWRLSMFAQHEICPYIWGSPETIHLICGHPFCLKPTSMGPLFQHSNDQPGPLWLLECLPQPTGLARAAKASLVRNPSATAMETIGNQLETDSPQNQDLVDLFRHRQLGESPHCNSGWMNGDGWMHGNGLANH